MNKTYFITGTDTEVGKTLVSAALLHSYQQQGFSTLGLKPIASGSKYYKQKLYNLDALLLQRYSSLKLDYKDINPFCFKPAIPPHIAANLAQKPLTADMIVNKCLQHMNKATLTIIEGAGGWLTPINLQENYSKVVCKLNIPVILIVGIKLGCINHSLLTIEHIKSQNLNIVGWIANETIPLQLPTCTKITRQQYFKQHIDTICKFSNIPCLAEIPYQQAIYKKNSS